MLRKGNLWEIWKMEEFKLLIDKMNQGPGMGLTEETFKGAHVITNPEWRCPLCITRFEGESWGVQALICDTRDDVMPDDEIFTAPLGYMSPPVEKAIGYLKTVTLLNEIDNQEFNVH